MSCVPARHAVGCMLAWGMRKVCVEVHTLRLLSRSSILPRAPESVDIDSDLEVVVPTHLQLQSQSVG